MAPRFIQIHTLTSYPAALLNRDDAGFAKRLPFGDAVRTRVSSQCLKRHWRTFAGNGSIASIPEVGGKEAMSVRSRRTFEHYVLTPLVDSGVSFEVAEAVTQAFIGALLGESAKAKAARDAKKKDGDGETPPDGSSVHTNQLTVLGRPEVDYILEEARAVCAEVSDAKEAKTAVEKRLKSIKKNIEALKRAAGLDAALFGRMVTSDILARGDAAVHVAHAFTTHAESDETDYFSAVDDLLRESGESDLGSAHINTSELASGLYYGYVVVDVPLLVSNLEGVDQSEWTAADRSLAGEVVARLIQIVATVSPGAKLGSTAPYAYADLVLVEAGDAQPRTLANAFLAPVGTSRSHQDLLENTYGALGRYVVEIDEMYGPGFERRLAARGPVEALGEMAANGARAPLPDVARWAAERIGKA